MKALLQCFVVWRHNGLVTILLLGIVFFALWWFRVDFEKLEVGAPASADGIAQKVQKVRVEKAANRPGSGERSGIVNSTPQNAAEEERQPKKFRTRQVETPALLACFEPGEQSVHGRVRRLQATRGNPLADDEIEFALYFLSGRQVPYGIGKTSMRWLADELLTVMRLQNPPWDGLADELGKAAFQPDTDPVVRDYIMQHLGLLWEQHGAREKIEKTLWQAVATSDETTPGTALIALSRGYERDGETGNLAKVRQQALALAQNPLTPLPVRVTALSIAGDGGGEEIKRLAEELAGNPESAVILKRVAERLVR